MSILKKSLINAVSSLAGYVLPASLSFISTPILLHRLGDEAFGLQNLVGVITGYFMIMDLGLDISLTKLLAEFNAKNDRNAGNKLLNTALHLYAIVGILGSALIYMLSEYFAAAFFSLPLELVQSGKNVFVLAAIGFFFSMFVAWGQAAANGIQRYDLSNIIKISSSMFGTVIGLVVVLVGYGVVEYVFCRVFVMGLSGCCSLFIVKRNINGFKFSLGTDWPVLFRVLRYSGYGILMRISGFLSAGLDKTLVAKWVGIGALSAYVIPSTIMMMITYLIANMLAFVMPMASGLSATGQTEKLRDFFERAFRFNAGIGAIAICPLIYLGEPLLQLWIGDPMSRKSSMILFLLLIFGFVGLVTATVPNAVAIGVGKIDRFTVYTIVRSTMFAFGLTSIKWLGIEGAAYALLPANLVEIAFMIYCIKYIAGVEAGKFIATNLLPALFLALILTFGGWICKLFVSGWITLGVAEILLAVSGTLLAFKMRIFGETEKRAISLIFAKIASN